MGSVPGFLQFSWVGPWGAISFPASAVHLLYGNGVPANSRRSKTLRATAVKLVNIQGIEKRVNMIQNQSGVTKMQLNSTFSSSIYPQWCFSKAALPRHACRHPQPSLLAFQVSKLHLALLRRKGIKPRRCSPYMLRIHEMIELGTCLQEQSQDNALLLFTKGGRASLQKLPEGSEHLSTVTAVIAEQTSTNWLWIRARGSVGSFSPAEEGAFLGHWQQVRSMRSGKAVVPWWCSATRRVGSRCRFQSFVPREPQGCW